MVSAGNSNTKRVNKSTPRVYTRCVQSCEVKTIGERIRQAREAKGLSGQALAELVGYRHQSAIGNLEARASGQGGNKIGAIADALGVPLEWLMRGPDANEIPFLAKSAGLSYSVAEPSAALIIHDTDPTKSIDPWTYEAVQILTRLNEADRRAAVLNLRTFVQNLGPPGNGQTLPTAKLYQWPHKGVIRR